MFNSSSSVNLFFGEQGPLAKKLSSYRPRATQIEMAQAIADALNQQDILITEAGTGTGKTFAYLVPALLQGGKVIVSTGTKNLQDQLYWRDIPQLRELLPIPITIALLKGRANYICRHRLEQTLESGMLESREQVDALHKIEFFSRVTKTGDKNDLPEISENHAIWNWVTSTRENCLGSECDHYQECFLVKARKEAQQADLLVVNHHLFFADVMLRDTGLAELLPAANTIIFDEAHQLPEVASLFFSEKISSAQIHDLCRDALLEGVQHARDACAWPQISSEVEHAVHDLRLSLTRSGRLSVQQIPEPKAFFSALENLEQKILTLKQALEKNAERAESLQQCAQRATELLQQLQNWGQANDKHAVYWLDIFSHSLQLYKTPLAIDQLFAQQRANTQCSWIFVSATLSVNGDFSHYQQQMGLNSAKTICLASPFNYAQQGLLYVPEQMPLPNSPIYHESLLKIIVPILEQTEGRAFLLCTTLSAMKILYERLQEIFAQRNLSFPLLMQGTRSKRTLLDEFCKAGNAVLIGSQSFWEGVDVPGNALSVVIIDKLPFAPPDDPIVAARLQQLARDGRNGFMEYTLPQAVIDLRQGCGRLIRHEQDQGLLVIADPRIVQKSYGSKMWRSLPPFKRTRDWKVVNDFLQQLNKQDCLV